MRVTCIILTIISALFLACSEIDDPAINIIERYRFIPEGDNQKVIAGNYLADSIGVTVIDMINGTNVAGMKVDFEITSGNGEVERASGVTDSRGKLTTRWKLGRASSEQLMKAVIYNPQGEYRGTLEYYATGFITNSWSATASWPEIRFADMAGDSINNFTLAITDGALFTRGEEFFTWNVISDYFMYGPREIFVGPGHTFYITTWDGFLYRSTDPLLEWFRCAKPWPSHDYYFELAITANNYFWATTVGKGLRCSRDGGQTWTTDTIGLTAGEILGDMFRLTDGTCLFLSQNCNLNKSVDDGHTWTKMDVPEYPQKLYVTENDEVILFNSTNGMSIYKSVDKGNQFVLKHSVNPRFHTTMNHTVHKWGNWYYILVPGYGVLRTPDFESYLTLWTNGNAHDMHMDAEGNLLVTDLDRKVVHYYNNPDE